MVVARTERLVRSRALDSLRRWTELRRLNQPPRAERCITRIVVVALRVHVQAICALQMGSPCSTEATVGPQFVPRTVPRHDRRRPAAVSQVITLLPGQLLIDICEPRILDAPFCRATLLAPGTRYG